MITVVFATHAYIEAKKFTSASRVNRGHFNVFIKSIENTSTLITSEFHEISTFHEERKLKFSFFSARKTFFLRILLRVSFQPRDNITKFTLYS